MRGTHSDCDIAIVGGGLAGGLAALAIRRAHPHLALRLIESGAELGGNHRWSWFATDLDPSGTALMDLFAQNRWDDGYDVTFPPRQRRLPTPYRSLTSSDFAATLHNLLPKGTVLMQTPVAAVEAHRIALPHQGSITAHHVIDARGFGPTQALCGGWQLFMGRHLRLASPHGLTRPVIMDAAVTQLDGYRFVYVLPLSETELFVEDTYYNDTPALDAAALGQRISAYCAAKGWAGTVLHEETGVLPVITGGDFARWQRELAQPGVARIGARGGFVHPLTSYTLPFAVKTALHIAQALAARPQEPGALARDIEQQAQAHWNATAYYRLLADMLFGAAEPAQRYRVFQRFYGLAPGLIERFYAARSTLADKARVLCGKPPVPLGAALRAIATSRPALLQDAAPLHEGDGALPPPFSDSVSSSGAWTQKDIP